MLMSQVHFPATPVRDHRSYQRGPQTKQPRPAIVTTDHDPGLRKPWYGISFGAAYPRVYLKYTSFTGRASRGEYWWWWLGNLVMVTIGVCLIGGVGVEWEAYRATPQFYGASRPLNPAGVVMTLTWTAYLIFTVIPALAAACRRLHDSNHSGLWILMGAVPVVGWVWLLVLLARRTYQAPTRWDYAASMPGASPYAYAAAGTPRRSY